MIQKKALELITSSKTVIVNSISKEGFPISRAMLTIGKRLSLQEMYFSTNMSSQKVNQFLSNKKASLYYHNQTSFQGLLMIGYIDVLTDQETKDFFWEQGDENYYKKGKIDPDYCILRFRPFEGQYYHNLSVEKFTVE